MNGEEVSGVQILRGGDYVECQADEPTSDAYPPKFFWVRSRTQVMNDKGPSELSFPNTIVPTGVANR